MTTSVPGLTNYPVRAVPIAQKTLAAAGISNTYAIVDSVFAQPVVLLIIVSTLDQAVQLSWDGTTDAIPLPAGGTIIIDFKSDNIVFPGTYGVYAKEIGNPATGTLYVGAFTT